MHDLIGLEFIVALGIAILAGDVVARRLRLPSPVLLLLCGVALGFLPDFRDVRLPPEVVLLVFLPMLLFWESLTTVLGEPDDLASRNSAQHARHRALEHRPGHRDRRCCRRHGSRPRFGLGGRPGCWGRPLRRPMPPLWAS
jgi:hypothetical protein